MKNWIVQIGVFVPPKCHEKLISREKSRTKFDVIAVSNILLVTVLINYAIWEKHV